MFGLPPGNPLREAVVELTRDHTRTVGGLTGTEPPLLRLLQVAVRAGTSGAAGGAGRSKNSAPLDVTALTIWDDISECVARHWPGRGDPTKQHIHLIDRLTWWTNTVAGGPHEEHLLEMCTWWIAKIRNLLEPPKLIPLRGVKCLHCKETWLTEESEDGTTKQPVLLAQISEELTHGVLVTCRACEGEYSGLGLQLMAG